MTASEQTSSRLAAARQAVNAHDAELRAISMRMGELALTRQRKTDEAGEAQQPRQEKRSLLARILRRGGAPAPDESAELKAISARIERAAPAAETAVMEAEVIGELLGELQAQADALHQVRPPLLRELAEAQFDAALLEIEQRALPEFFAAAEAFRKALGQLVGLGIAHNDLWQQAAQVHGAQCASPIGADAVNATRTVRLALPGFGIEERLRGHPTLQGGHQTLLTLDAGQIARTVADEALRRWQAL